MGDDGKFVVVVVVDVVARTGSKKPTKMKPSTGEKV